MKNEKTQAVFALLFVALLLSVIQISGCDSTKGKSPVASTPIPTSSLLAVTSIVGSAATKSGGVPSEIDIHIIPDCDFDPTTNPPVVEKVFDDEATVTISNSGPLMVNITSYTVDFVGKDAPSNVTIPSFSAGIASEVSANGTASLIVTIIKVGDATQSGTKLWYAARYGTVNFWTFTAKYTFTGTDSRGATVSVSGNLEIKLGSYNNC